MTIPYEDFHVVLSYECEKCFCVTSPEGLLADAHDINLLARAWQELNKVAEAEGLEPPKPAEDGRDDSITIEFSNDLNRAAGHFARP